MTTVNWKGNTRSWSGFNRSLCWGCGEIFGGVSGFQKHQKGGECLSPESVGLKLQDGYWVGEVKPGAFTEGKG